MKTRIAMKNKGVALLLLLAFLLMTGCAGLYSAPVIPGRGLLYAEVKAPMDFTVDKTQLGSKVGKAVSTNVLGWIVTGDCSIQAAAKSGGVQVIHHVDYSFKNVLGIYAEFTTIVYGD